MSVVARYLQATIDTEFARAVAAHRAGRLPEAVEGYRALARRLPRNATVRANLGAALDSLGWFEDAVAACREAIALEPGHADAWHNLGNALANARALGSDFAAATASLASDLEAAPEDRETRAALESAATRVGKVLVAAGRPGEAVDLLRRAVAAAPDSHRLLDRFGLALQSQGAVVAAIDAYRRAIALSPKSAGAYANLAAAHFACGDVSAAEAAARIAVAINPQLARAHNNLGGALEWQGRFGEALAEYRVAVALRPEDGQCHANLAYALLASGALADGWREHSWRWCDPKFTSPRRPFAHAAWNGTPQQQGTVLLWGEQGIGDEILFASIVPDAAARAGRCVLECEPRLAPLFARSFPQVEVVARCDPQDPRTLAPDVRAHAPTGDLPQWLRTHFEDFPPHRGYLRADPARVRALRELLASAGPGPVVGLSWRTLRPTVERAVWYAPLARWESILMVPGISFVNLQAGDCRAELDAVREHLGVTVHEVDGVDLFADLDGVAALIAATDVVVSQPNSVVALAGALGRPVWILLSDVPNWRWFRDRDDSPWYPSARLFRQQRHGDWDAVFGRVAAALRSEDRARPGCSAPAARRPGGFDP